MAFVYLAKYVQNINLDDLDKEHFLVLAVDAALKLEWDILSLSEKGFVAETNSTNETITVILDNETANTKSKSKQGYIDFGGNKQNVEKLIASIYELKDVLTPTEIETRLAELQQSYVSAEEDILSQAPLTTKQKIADFFVLLIPTEGYFISPILMNINIAIFVAMLISGVHILEPKNWELINWGANFLPYTLNEQWRLLTACFLHIGIFHLLLNLYALLYIGILLEPYIGNTRFLSAYLITGIASSVASLWWNNYTISAGASGAIFGMYGVFLALLTTNLFEKDVKKGLLTSIAIFIGANILYGLQNDSGVDNAAHIGGILSGLIIGYAFVPSLKNFDNAVLKLSTIGALTVVLVVASFSVCKTLSDDINEYEAKIEKIGSMESMALEIYNLPEGTSDEEILSEIKDRGLYYWNENLKLIENFKKLNLPLPIRERNDKLKEYFELRIKSYELIYKAIDEDTDKYQKEISNYDQKLETIIAELTEEEP